MTRQNASNPETAASQKTKPALIWIAAIALVTGGLVAGWLVWSLTAHLETTDDAFSGADSVILSSRVAGKIANIRVGDNEPVEREQVLFQIDDTDYRLAVAQNEAEIHRLQLGIETIQHRIAAAIASAEEAEAGIVRARAEARRAGDDYDRYAALKASQHASVQRFEDARARKAGADADVTAAMARFRNAKAVLRALENEIEETKAAIKEAEARLTVAQTNLESTIVRAPFSGIASNRRIETGAWIQPGMAALSIVPIHQIYVEANFKETQLSDMRPGQPAEIVFDAWPDIKLAGHVETISPASGAVFSLLPPQNATGNYTKVVQRFPVRIALHDIPAAIEGRLLAGLSAEVTVDTSGSTR